MGKVGYLSCGGNSCSLYFITKLISLSRPSPNLCIHLGGIVRQKHSLSIWDGALGVSEFLRDHGGTVLRRSTPPRRALSSPLLDVETRLICNVKQDIANQQDPDICRTVPYNRALNPFQAERGTRSVPVMCGQGSLGARGAPHTACCWWM